MTIDHLKKNPSTYVGDNRLLIGIVLGVLTFWLFAQSLSAIGTNVQTSLMIQASSLNLAVSLTALFSGSFIVVAGGLADRFGRLKFTYLGFILSILGCLSLIFAQGTSLLIIGRILQGLSGACIMPATLALVKTYYDGAARQRAFSFWAIGSFGGSGFCLFFAGVIDTYFGWRTIFIISIAVALLGMFLIKNAPESKTEESEEQSTFDYIGLALFVLMLISLNLFITKGRDLGWLSLNSILLFTAFIILFIFFYKVEKKKLEGAFIDFAIFKNKAFLGATLSNCFLNSAAGTLFILSQYMQKGRNLSSFENGLMTLGYSITILLMIRVGEKILQKIGAKKPMLLGAAFTGLGIIFMSMTFLPNSFYFPLVFGSYILFGIGLGFFATPATDTAISNVPSDRIGVASGIFKMGSALGVAFGIAISSTIYTATQAISIDHGAFYGLMVNALFCLLAFLSVMFIIPSKIGRR